MHSNKCCAKGGCAAVGKAGERKKYGRWRELEDKAMNNVALGSLVWEGCPLSKDAGLWL